jgi:ABC-type Fe3+/spermidine/putrescine transport system ATPase subunit
MAGIELEHVTKAFAGGVVAVDDVSLSIAAGNSWSSSARPAAASRRCCG